MQQQRKWALLLIRFAAISGFIGVLIGSIMSGEMNYSLRPIHAHFVLVGWLSVFAWGIFYYSVPIRKLIFVKIQSILGMIGAFGLCIGMWLYNLNPLDTNETLNMVFFIVGGSILLIAFFFFIIVTFFVQKYEK
ncbi:hypothetical protein MKZ25_17410 [Solibacillus sp. FSL W7-1464]|uniref:hypothetical protein n=1 Tax=Solibacillus sp. FSL W7-1464 TaxID=2921706 RepID=UPI0030FA4165